MIQQICIENYSTNFYTNNFFFFLNELHNNRTGPEIYLILRRSILFFVSYFFLCFRGSIEKVDTSPYSTGVMICITGTFYLRWA